jgi:UDP-N-acetylmuramoylalanine--D-glutamate ligase
MAYHGAKHRIFQGCKQVVENADDQLTAALVPDYVTRRQFTLSKPDLKQYGICQQGTQDYLCCGFEKLIACAEVAMTGSHNMANALAALALGDSVGLPRQAMLASLREFVGLAHRCELVAEQDGVIYINDSKGTNVGATVAAILGLGTTITGQVILLAGGVGQDGDSIGDVLAMATNVIRAKDLVMALQQARALAQPGDLVLLSPACASFDAYSNFEKRGDHFRQLVEAQA